MKNDLNMIYIDELARGLKIHRQTVENWLPGLNIQPGWRMGSKGIRRRALKHDDAQKVVDLAKMKKRLKEARQ